jgi:DNA topoisomerase I
MNLVIVESPTKAKTITKFLDKKYVVESSFGHIRDLPTSVMGIDIDNNFEPSYKVPAKAKKTVTKLKELAKKADNVILATDEDREGEAIAWHLSEALKIKADKADRIVFHEITKTAIEEALQNPRKLDMKLVDAQQARRVLDRLVGYELSPFLWKKVAKGLSAGRVQSVAVRLIVERERERQKFVVEEYWSIIADLQSPNFPNIPFISHLNKVDGKTLDKLEIKDKEQADIILKNLRDAKYEVASVEKKKAKRNAPAPFTTSTLQQAANRMLGFSAKQTMMVAQQLYEGIDLSGEGHVGLITYMRTDSLNLSEKFLGDAQEYLKNSFGEKYALAEPRKFKTKSKGAQEAHEAIRPSEASRDPEALKDSLNTNQYRLYKLIWQRALASQMPAAEIDATVIDIDAIIPSSSGGQGESTPPFAKGGQGGFYQFRANGQVIKFDGYLKIYPEKSQEIELPDVSKKDSLELLKLNSEQHFTKPPARYSDAGLVKAMERYGIGRPSTYAPTIATIIDRNYANRDEAKKLFPTDIAFVVIDLLVTHFPQVVDYEFTANMEKNFDDIAEGETKWQPVIKDFYDPFHHNLELKYKEINKNDIMPEETSNEICDKCGAPMIIKTGRYGKFLACSAFPDCKNIKGLNGNGGPNGGEKSEEVKALEEKYKDEVCEKCGSPMAVKNGRFGAFLGCTGYPKCKNIKNIVGQSGGGGTGVKCPNCDKGEIVAKRSRRGTFYGCNNYPDCKTALWAKPTGEKCPDCGALLVENKGGAKCSNKECGYEK